METNLFNIIFLIQLVLCFSFLRNGVQVEAFSPFFQNPFQPQNFPPNQPPSNPFMQPSGPQSPIVHQVNKGYHHQQTIYMPYNNPLPNIFPANGFSSFPSQNYHVPMKPVAQVPFNPSYSFFSPTTHVQGNSANRNKVHQLASSPNRQSGSPATCVVGQYYGQCDDYHSCSSKSGYATYSPLCSEGCCLSAPTCSGSTDAMYSYFFNPQTTFSAPRVCGVTVKKSGSHICIVRVNIIRLNLPAFSKDCTGINFEVTGVPYKDYRPLCGRLSTFTLDVDIEYTDSVSFIINNSPGYFLQWSIQLQQISCSSPLVFEWPVKTPTTEVPPPSSTPPTPPTPPTPVPPPGQCGYKYLGSQRNNTGFSNLGNRGQIPNLTFGITQAGRRASQKFKGFQIRPHFNEFDAQKLKSSFTNSKTSTPLLSSLDWVVPNVNDSILSQVAGPPRKLSGRITFGKKTKRHEYTWVVAMVRRGNFHCGASLISETHVLTAAHCVETLVSYPESLTLSIGEWDLNSNDGKSIEAKASKIVVHPDYSSRTLKNDIAIITLRDPVQFTETIAPICLPGSDIPLDESLVTVMGWGRDENSRLQTVLMEHTSAVVGTSACNDRWGSDSITITHSMLCMDTQNGDSCKGDSGGPSVMEYPVGSGRYIQVGIVSFGSASCTDKNLPGVYTKVTKYIDWIKQNTL